MKPRPPPAPSFPHISAPPNRAVWWLVQSPGDIKPHLVLNQSAYGAAMSRSLLMSECVRLERVPEVGTVERINLAAAIGAVTARVSNGAALA